MPEPTERPATLEEIIQGIARKEGVSPTLALAVAKRESSLNPTAKSPKGALGLFQLMPATAAELGVDPMDPVQNITGGVRYLKQLSDRYQGDVQKTLWAYNGGMGRVDKGEIPAESQAYAANILADLSAAARTQATTPGVQPMTSREGTQPEQPGYLRQMAAAFDPRTPQGRRSLAATAGAATATALTGGVGAPAALAVAAPIVGAGLAAGAEEVFEQGIGTKPTDNREVLKAAATEGAFEGVGGAFMWPIRRVARAAVGSNVAKAAVRTLGEKGREVSAAASDLVRATRDRNAGALESVKATADAVLGRAKAVASRLTQASDDAARARVQNTAATWAGRQASAKARAADSIAKAELDADEAVRTVTQTYERMVGRAPSVEGAGTAARTALAGLPGLVGQGEGPVKRALDLAGQRIAAAAQDGPPVQMAPLKTALNEMAGKVRPTSLFPVEQGNTRGIGFLRNVDTGKQNLAAAASAQFKNDPAMLEILRKQIGAALGLPETHPLPGVLAQLQNAPETLSFADAHQLKRLLDEAVNWDRSAKKHLEGLTKGIRSTLREAMSGHAPYDEATAAYQALVPLYRKGVGAQVIRDAATNPDRVARALNSKNPAAATAIRDLLVGQAAAGGDAAAGQQAWDAIRATYTYDHVITGGIEKLGQRLSKLQTESPEFVKVVYGDQTAQQILGNLQKLAEAYQSAVAHGLDKAAAAKVSGESAVQGTKWAGEAAVTAAKRQADEAAQAATGTARQVVTEAAQQGKQAVRAQQGANRQSLTRSMLQAREMREGHRATVDRFKESSLRKFVGDDVIHQELADTARATALGPGSFWGAMSAIRLLTRDAKATDILEWAAYSDYNTSRLTKLLMGQLPPRAAANVLREVVSVITPPVASHHSTEEP